MTTLIHPRLRIAYAIVVFVLSLGIAATTSAATPELPTFDVENFSNPTEITNPWLSLPVGRELEYKGETEDGTETITITISGHTKTVFGIETLIYRDTVWLDGEIVEDTTDYLAQDDDGNVWYLGEDVDNYEDGVVIDHDGSWLAGVDGALPGYWMKADPQVGDYYKQEFYEGEAEDEAKVLGTSERVQIELGTYRNCLKIQDIVPGDAVVEYKYYCKEVGGLVLEEKPEEDESVELVEYDTDFDDEESDSSDASNVTIRTLQTKIIALLNQLIALLSHMR